MGNKFSVVLTWAERIGQAIIIAVPAIRDIASVMDPMQPEVLPVKANEEE